MARPGVRGTFSQPGPSRPTAAVRLARTLGITNAMDTAIIVIPKPSAHGLATFLTELLPGQSEPWIVMLNGRAAIYINIVPGEQADLEPEELLKLTERFEGQELTALAADVAIRNVGCAELRELVVAVLGRFPGLASDDIAEHWWTAEEILEPKKFGFQPFWPHEVNSRMRGHLGDA